MRPAIRSPAPRTSIVERLTDIATSTFSETRLRYGVYGRPRPALHADIDGDGAVNTLDLTLMLASFGSVQGQAGPPVYNASCDLNHDNAVNTLDLTLLLNWLGKSDDQPPAAEGTGAGAMSFRGCLISWGGSVYDPAAGLYLMRNRWYDPNLGRWITRDPAGYVDGMSLYVYVKGNPLMYFDPFGMVAWYEGWGTTIATAFGFGEDSGSAAKVWSGAAEGAVGGVQHELNSATFGATDATGITDTSQYQGAEYVVSDMAGAVARDTAIALATAGAGNAVAAAAEAGQVASTTAAVVNTAGRAYSAVQTVQGAAQGVQNVAQGNYATGALQLGMAGLAVAPVAKAAANEVAAAKNLSSEAKGGVYALVDQEKSVMRPEEPAT